MSHPGMLQPAAGAAGGSGSSSGSRVAAAGGGVGLAAPQQQRMQQVPGSSGSTTNSPPPGDGDVDMAAADPVLAPIILHNEREPVRGGGDSSRVGGRPGSSWGHWEWWA